MKLIIEDDAGRKTVVPLSQEQISIGREPGNTVRLGERNVSRRHALLVREDDAIVIEDLGSHNGVRVNGDRIQGRSRVKQGDVIQIGDYDLALEDESKAAERPTQPNLTPVPDHVGQSPRSHDVPFHRESEAVARFQKAAAIQALLAKGDPASVRPRRPQAAPAGAPEQWPADFHFVAPGSIEQMAAQARRRRYILGSMIGSAVLFAAVLAFGFLRRESPAAAPAFLPDPAPAATAAPPPEHAPVAPASPPENVAPTPSVAPAPVPASAPKPSKPSASEAPRRRALDLYQDAFADVGNGDYSDALAKLQASIALDPASPAAQKEIAICYTHLNQPAKGAAHYEQYLKLRPDAPDAADVRRMLSDYHASKGSE